MIWRVGDLVTYTAINGDDYFGVITKLDGSRRIVRVVYANGVVSSWSHSFTPSGLRKPKEVPDCVRVAHVAYLLTGEFV